MAFYTDEDPDTSHAMCIALMEGGTSLCGSYDCSNEITSDHVESVWELFEDDRIHDSCECRERLREHLGLDSEDELERVLRDRRSRKILQDKRAHVQRAEDESDEPTHDQQKKSDEEPEGLGELFG